MRTLIKFLIFPALFMFAYFCNNAKLEEETTGRNVPILNPKLKKCNGKQAYFHFILNGEKYEISPTAIKNSNVYSDEAAISRVSTYSIEWQDNNIEGTFMLASSSENFKTGSMSFPTDYKKHEITMTMQKGDQGKAYRATSGTLNIDGFNYILKGRDAIESRDFIKGSFSGTLKNALNFLGDKADYHIEVDFCLCGEIGI